MEDILEEIDHMLADYFEKHGESAGSIYLGQAQFAAFKASLFNIHKKKLKRGTIPYWRGIAVYRVKELLHINCGE